jgi:hypothetical protein
MNLLRNPMVTGVLVVAALCVVAYRFLPSGWWQSHRLATSLITPAAPPAGAPAPARAPAPAAAVTAAKGTNRAVRPDAPIDRDYVQAHFAHWVEAPARDPFQLLVQAQTKPSDVETNSPVTHWKLKGIWDQTGSRLAIINRDVYALGDEIQGYKLIEIGTDEVWFQGPRRKERLGLDNQPPAPRFPPQAGTGTNPAASAQRP